MIQRPFAAYSGDQPYIFVSYSHSDAERVYPLLSALKQRGLNIWYDEGLEPGSSWRAGLADSIQNCERVLFLVSSVSASSRNCEREIEYALSKNKPICVCFLERTQLTSSLDFSLGSEQAIFADHYELPAFTEKVEASLRGLKAEAVSKPRATLASTRIQAPRSTSSLIERDDIIQRILQAVETSRDGHGGMVLVSGEAGVGKTALLSQLRRQQPDNCTVLWGACDALFTPRALGPVQDMAPGLGLRVQRALAEGTATSQLFSLLLEQLDSQSDPTVMVFEDVHWADHATLDLIKYLARRISLLNVLLVLSFRSEELDSTHPLTQVLGDLPSAQTTRLKLQPLSRAGVEQLAAQANFPAERLFEVTAGNPFFVTELIAAHSVDTSVPASVRDAVGARLQRLDAPIQELMETISVIPSVVSGNLIAQLFGAQGEQLAASCVDHGLLVEDQHGLRFRHELARLATLGRSTESKKKQAHTKILAAMEDMPSNASYAEMVHHATGAYDGKSVLRWGAAAAKQAASIGAHREAAAHLNTALQFVDEAAPEQAAQLHEDWAYEAGLALQIDDVVIAARGKAVDLWRELGRMDKVGENLRWLSRLHWYRGEAAHASRLADEAVTTLEGIPASVERGMAYSLRSQLHMLNDRMDEAISWGQRALKLADEFNNAEVRIHALNNVGTALLFRGKPGGREMMEESLALARTHHHDEHAARVYTNLAEYGVETRDFELAEQVLSEGIAFDTQHDLDAWTHYLVGRLAQLRLEQGRLNDARTIAEGVLKLDQLTLLMRLPARIVLAKASVRRGDPDAQQLLEQALVDAEATGERQYTFPVRMGMIEQAWLTDQPDSAKRELSALLDDGVELLRTWDQGEIATWANRLGLPMPEAFLINLPGAYHQEVTGDFELAAKHWEDLGAPYSACLALVCDLEHLTADHVQHALALANAMDASAVVNKITQLAQQQGVLKKTATPKQVSARRSTSHPLGLNEREQVVLRQIVGGASNQEIALELERSERTVVRNVATVLQKLNAQSRIEALLRVKNEPWLLQDAD